MNEMNNIYVPKPRTPNHLMHIINDDIDSIESDDPFELVKLTVDRLKEWVELFK